MREALAITRGDYDVEVVPGFIERSEGRFHEATRGRYVIRTDTGAELGAVGMDYTAVQNRDAFGILQPLLDEGVLTLETGGQLRGGADAWLLGRFDLSKYGPDAQQQFGELGVLPYAMVANNHSGRRGIMVSLTEIRVVCANTLGAAERAGEERVDQTIIVRHTKDAEARLVDAAHKLFHEIIERSEVIARQYKLLKAHHLDTALFRELVLNAVAPDPRKHPKWNPEARMANAVVERWERKVARVTHLWHHGDGHVGDNSAWEAYNAAVQALDHDADLFPARSGVYRTASLMQGNLKRMKQQVIENLVHNATLALSA